MTQRIARHCWLLVLFASAALSAEEGRQVAITIDDLPRGGDRGPSDLSGVRAMTHDLMRPFREQHIPVIGFVNTGRSQLDSEGMQEVLKVWLDAGAKLGNHSYSHPDINSVALDVYTDDIARGEPAIRQALASRGKKLEFYRHPYLHTGPTPQIKKGLQDVPYMESIVEFFERRSIELFGREIPQILLIHANAMNAELMPELLAMFRRRGYRFVSLETALADPAYRSQDEYAGRNGFSWIHRWSKTKGLAAKGEPDPPEWVTKALEDRR